MWHLKLKSTCGLMLVFVGFAQCATIPAPVESTPPNIEPTKAAVPPPNVNPVELSSDGEHLAVATPLAGFEKKFRKVGEMTSRLSEKAPELERLARFIFDLGGTNSNDGYTTSDGTTNLFNLNIDSARVIEGLFRPDYVAIHVAQNAFNFFTSSLAWVVASGLYETTNSGRGLFGSNPDSYSSSSSGYTIPSYKSPSSTGGSNTYNSPSSSYGAPLLTSKSSFSSGPLSFLSKTIADSALFNAFAPNKPSKSSSNYDYESRKIKVTEDNEAVSAEDPITGMSVDQIQHLLEAEEQGQANMFSNLSEEQKYKMYQRAKNAMLAGSRRHEVNGEPSLTFVDQTGPAQESHPLPEDMELDTGVNLGNNKPVVRRRRKLIRKPLDQTPRKVEE
ncbi:hypothetical protein TCAL_08139 [Tigriopus californicus]|uniref:Uncharacterized protein n=1 Tax=Tigriopus californicus TaxID=6832 RepID=A0A553PJJ7_TIGCA|nr:uncharacterized protein LOC131891096 [Tigriopus californicus]TRY77871.1 hypothetical protein TCAL_08139 [Tigriopus californicus]